MTDVVQQLWGFCHTLRHEGVDYGDYIEQVTYLLFIKMADERGVELPKDCDWATLRDQSGTELTDHYVDTLRVLGRQPGLLGDIFAGGQSRFGNPVSLKRLLGVIDDTQWTELGVDVKAQAFEGLLEKAASEGKKGAGQYFTPRLLIDVIVRCVKPDPRVSDDFAICDPACGTGGFLVSAYEWLIDNSEGGGLDRATSRRIAASTYFGQNLVERPRRLALMNLYLHGLNPHITLGDSIYDAPMSDRYDVILTNPPFGVKGASNPPSRDDFVIETSNKQLNFLQHILTILKPGGRAAVVLPDNCLFADQAAAVLELLMEDCEVHTLLRLPNGTFTPYSPSTKTNVIFFTKGAPTERMWVYDARTNVPHITKQSRPLTRGHFEEFERCFGDHPFAQQARQSADSQQDRWRSFHLDEIKALKYKVEGLRWLQESAEQEVEDPQEPEELATEALTELRLAADELAALVAELSDPTDDEAALAGGESARAD